MYYNDMYEYGGPFRGVCFSCLGKVGWLFFCVNFLIPSAMHCILSYGAAKRMCSTSPLYFAFLSCEGNTMILWECVIDSSCASLFFFFLFSQNFRYACVVYDQGGSFGFTFSTREVLSREIWGGSNEALP
jgi:hypothetical protein